MRRRPFPRARGSRPHLPRDRVPPRLQRGRHRPARGAEAAAQRQPPTHRRPETAADGVEHLGELLLPRVVERRRRLERRDALRVVRRTAVDHEVPNLGSSRVISGGLGQPRPATDHEVRVAQQQLRHLAVRPAHRKMHRRLSRGAEPLLDVRAAQVATQQRRVAARTAQQRKRDSLSADSRCSEQQVAAVIRDIVEQHAQKLRRPAAATGAAAAIAIGAGVAPQGGGAPKARRVARQGSVAVLRTRRRLRARGSARACADSSAKAPGRQRAAAVRPRVAGRARAVRRWLVEERAEEGQDELARGLDVPDPSNQLAG